MNTYHISMGTQERQKSAGFNCFGCGDILTISSDDNFSWDDQTNLASKLGWRRREFSMSSRQTANPWFCSKECSLNSIAAQECESYWRNHTK